MARFMLNELAVLVKINKEEKKKNGKTTNSRS
jgi:hypothetical protein